MHMLDRLRALLGGTPGVSGQEAPKRAIEEPAESIDALMAKAIARHQAGDLESAEGLFRKILALHPAHAKATHHLGMLFAQRGDYRQAEAFLRSATLLQPNDPVCFLHLGNALRGQKRFAEAIAAYRDSIACVPTVEACLCIGDALQESGETEGVRESYERALAMQSNLAGAWNGLSCLEKTLGNPEESIRMAERALSCDSLYFHAYNNKGLALHMLGRIEEAIDHFLLAIIRNPGYAEAYNNLGNALVDLGRLDKAISNYAKALELRPDYHDARWNLALAFLKRGDFERGWQLYEDRTQRKGGEANRRNFVQPGWEGEDLRGRTILLHAEQGFGDAIQFVRYVSLVKPFGGTIHLEVHPELERLLHDFPGVASVVARGKPLPEFDVHCSLMSLPYRLGARFENIPATIPYVFVPEEMTKAWSARLEGERRMRIGLVWSSNVLNKAIHASKSVPLRKLGVLGEVPGVAFYSLQKGEGRKEIADAGLSLIDWTDELKDFCDTAALIANLDLVISVDTAVAHLAGALGKPVWMPIWLGGDWRWLQDRNDSPWYPDMRLFRQEMVGSWDAPLRHLREALEAAAHEFSMSGVFTNPAPLPSRPAMASADCRAAAEEAKGRGNAAYGEGDLARAEQCYREALSHDPEYAEAHNNLALVLRMQQRQGEAEKHLLRALDAQPGLTNARFNLGLVFSDDGRWREAIEQFRQVLVQDPDNLSAHIELGNQLGRQGLFDEAGEHLRRAISLDPDSPEAQCNFASFQFAQGNFKDAESAARRTIALAPDYADGHNILGAILQALGQPQLARAEFEQALELAPGSMPIRFNAALCLMLLGDYERGLALYESRIEAQRQLHGLPMETSDLLSTLRSVNSWQGEALAGKGILIWQEQGYGDVIMMLRYLPLLLERGASSIMVRCASPLVRLVAAMPGIGERVRVVDCVTVVPEGVDCHCSMMSLPHRFETRPGSIPGGIPYLTVPSADEASWRKRLAALPGLKVGLVWSGNSRNPSDAQRSLPLDRFGALLDIPGVSFVSLQKQAADAPLTPPGSRLHDWMGECTDFLDTAALVSGLDLVIGVDTAVIHLAGALGKPAWLLNRLASDWRWLSGGEYSPWYPTVRIFRQHALSDWDAPIAEVRAALEHAAGEFSRGRSPECFAIPAGVSVKSGA